MAGQRSHVNATGFKAWLKRTRRGSRERLNRVLARLLGTAEPRRAPLADDTRRVLVVRLNKRLGNILFLTPMLRTLAASLPAARIDVVIQDARQKALLETLPGIGRVWIQDKSLGASLRLLRTLRARHYDLAIDPSGNSASNRLAIALSKARQRMGFARTDQWVPLTHAAPRPRSRHQAQQAVELLASSVTGKSWDTFDSLAVFPSDAADRAAQAHWVEAFGATPVDAPVVAFFTQATGNKQLNDAWWSAFREQIAARLPNARLLQICPPGMAAPTDIASVCIPALDVLAATLSRVDAFVAADSGPMHLAAAAGVPVAGLFRSTSPAAYAPLGPDCVSLSGDALTPEGAVDAVADMIARRRTSGAA